MAVLDSAPLCHGEVGGGFGWTGKAFAPGQWRDCGYQGLELLEQMDLQYVSKERVMKALQFQDRQKCSLIFPALGRASHCLAL